MDNKDRHGHGTCAAILLYEMHCIGHVHIKDGSILKRSYIGQHKKQMKMKIAPRWLR